MRVIRRRSIRTWSSRGRSSAQGPGGLRRTSWRLQANGNGEPASMMPTSPSPARPRRVAMGTMVDSCGFKASVRA